MCGIVAVVGEVSGAGVAEAAARRSAALRHRGPDGAGTHRGERYVLAHRRLAILGDASVGAQPYVGEGFALAYNGEVHNYRELADRARSRGATVARGSDVPLVAGYLAEFGQGARADFDGFFAYVFVDERRRRAYAARDRFGQKPLLFRIERDAAGVPARIHFASERAGLPPAGARVRPSAVNDCVQRARYPTAPATFFGDTRQVRPGELLEIDLDTLELRSHARLREPEGPSVPRERATGAPLRGAGVRELVRAAVAERLISDRPVGLLLSAGIDSGLLRVVARPGQVAVNYAFDNGAPDSEYTEAVSGFAGRGQTRRVTLPAGDDAALRQRIATLHHHLDAPLLSASLLALDALFAAAASEGHVVLLSGQGADEVFGGYNYYRGDGAWLVRLAELIRAAGGGPAAARQLRDRRRAERLLDSLRDGRRGMRATPAPLDFEARRRYDLLDGPLADMLWYEDRLAMRHGVEVRYPYLDHDVVAYGLSLTWRELRAGGRPKAALVAAFGDQLPAHLRGRQPKRGLPGGESMLLALHHEVFADGLSSYGTRLDADVGPMFRRLRRAVRYPGALGPREARAMFRTACAGLWLEDIDAGLISE